MCNARARKFSNGQMPVCPLPEKNQTGKCPLPVARLFVPVGITNCDPVSQIETWPLILWPYGPLILWPLHGTYNINMLILWPCDPIWNLAKIWPKFDHWYSGPMDHWYCGLGQRATIKVWYCGLVAIDIVHLLILWNSPILISKELYKIHTTHHFVTSKREIKSSKKPFCLKLHHKIGCRSINGQRLIGLGRERAKFASFSQKSLSTPLKPW